MSTKLKQLAIPSSGLLHPTIYVPPGHFMILDGVIYGEFIADQKPAVIKRKPINFPFAKIAMIICGAAIVVASYYTIGAILTP